MGREGQADEGLMGRVRRGDAGAFEALYDRHAKGVFNTLLHLSGDRQTAEALTQETFLHVLERRAQYSPDKGAFRTWLFRIARNLLKDARRREAGARMSPLGVQEAALPDGALRPAATAERAEEIERLRAAIARLSEVEREVVVLHEIETLRYDQIAEITGESEGTLRSRLFGALRKLRRLLG